MGVGQQASPGVRGRAEPAAGAAARCRRAAGLPRRRRRAADRAVHGRAAARAGGRGRAQPGARPWSGPTGMAGWQPAAEVAELAATVRRGAAADPRCRLSRCAAGPWGGLRTERGRAGRRAASGSPRRSCASSPASSAARCSATRRARPSWSAPIAATATGSSRRRSRSSSSRSTRPCARLAGEAPPSQPRCPAKCGSCGGRLRLRAARLRRPVPVLRPARGGRPGGPGARSARGRPAVPDRRARRRAGWSATGSRACGSRPRASPSRRAGPAGCTASTCPTGPSTAAPAPRYSGRRGDVYYETQYVDTRGRRPPGAPGGAGAEDPLAPGARRRWRATSTTCWCWPGETLPAPPGRGAGALGPGRHAALHRRLPDRLRRRALPAAGRPGLRARPRRSCAR